MKLSRVAVGLPAQGHKGPGLTLVAVCLLTLAAAACGGGSSNKPAAVNKIATATLPPNLPTVKLLGSSAVQAGGASTYAVKDGDTLAGIATRLGLSLDDLRAANPGVDPATLRPGQSLKLPANTSPAQASAPSATARPATAAAATPEQATEAPPTAAPVATDTPAPPASTPAPEATSTPSSLGQTYVVQEGDFPAKIAAKFGITVEALLAANPGINPTGMHIGDVIIIPPKPPA